MTFHEFIDTENRFNRLFEKICKKGFSALSNTEKAEYNSLIQIINNPDNAENMRAYHNAISAGFIRLGY